MYIEPKKIMVILFRWMLPLHFTDNFILLFLNFFKVIEVEKVTSYKILEKWYPPVLAPSLEKMTYWLIGVHVHIVFSYNKY